MRKKRLTGLVVAAILLLAAGTMSAHHSATNYDTDKQITLQGTVTNFKFSNPHPCVHFQTKDEAGNVVEWIGESGSPPNRWYNSGWRANALKPGDAITVTGNPSKDGRKMLRLRKIVNSSGKEWSDGFRAQ